MTWTVDRTWNISLSSGNSSRAGGSDIAPVTFTMALHLPREANSTRSCAGSMACHAGCLSTSKAGIRSPRSPGQQTGQCKPLPVDFRSRVKVLEMSCRAANKTARVRHAAEYLTRALTILQSALPLVSVLARRAGQAQGRGCLR